MTKRFLMDTRKTITESKQTTSDYTAILKLAENFFGKSKTTNASRKNVFLQKEVDISSAFQSSFLDVSYNYDADDDTVYMEIDVVFMGETDQIFEIRTSSDVKTFQKYMGKLIKDVNQLNMGLQKVANMLR